MGRLVTLSTARPLSSILHALAAALAYPRAFNVALPSNMLPPPPSAPPDAQSEHSPAGERAITTVATCAGSGASVFGALKERADLLLTGEMSHHETLAAVERGSVVVLVGHSNSERGYLRRVLRGKLERALVRGVGDGVGEGDGEGDGDGEGIGQEGKRGGDEEEEEEGEGGGGGGGNKQRVFVSSVDRDPMGWVVLE